jgi:glucose/arabinose dehydrogenase
MNRTLAAATASGALIVGIAVTAFRGQSQEPPSALPFRPAFRNQTRAPQPPHPSAYAIETIASGLDHPWSLAFLPNGHKLATERNGTMRIIDLAGRVSAPLKGLPPFLLAGGHGLADVLLDPEFARNRFVYFSYLAPPPGKPARSMPNDEMNAWLNRPLEDRLKDPMGIPRVARARLADDEQRIENLSIILEGADRRMAWANDGTLFVMAETQTSGGVMFVDDLPQRLDQPWGKVLRVNRDGTIPRDNPFVGKPGVLPQIYAYGVRDPEGAAIEPGTGRLWISEHGVKGGDELNVILPGRNYGFPVITYGVQYNDQPIGGGQTAKAGMEQPVYFWNPDIAPSGLLFYTGSRFPDWTGDLFLGALLGKHLIRLRIRQDRVVFEEPLLTELKVRIRDVRQGPDGLIYVLTDEDNGQLLRLLPKEH